MARSSAGMTEEYRLKTMETTGPNPSPLYIKNPVIIQVPYLQQISPSPYLSIKPSTLVTKCGFFIYLYIGDLSHDRYKSFPRRITCVLTVYLLYSFLIFMMHHHLSHYPFVLITPLVHPFFTTFLSSHVSRFSHFHSFSSKFKAPKHSFKS